MRIALGADHAGFELKDRLKLWLVEQGHQAHDEGTNAPDSVDYPDYARRVAEDVAAHRADLGILVCGSGIGMAIAANKVRGVRASLCNDLYTARLARQHNDANVLGMGARIVAPTLAMEIVRVWLATPFEGGRHVKRLEQIAAPDRPIDGDRLGRVDRTAQRPGIEEAHLEPHAALRAFLARDGVRIDEVEVAHDHRDAFEAAKVAVREFADALQPKDVKVDVDKLNVLLQRADRLTLAYAMLRLAPRSNDD